jgi:AraC-like DNA-binding protein
MVADGQSPWIILVPLSATLIASLHPVAVLRLVRERRALRTDQLSRLDEADPAWLHAWSLATLATIILLGSTVLSSALLSWSPASQMIALVTLQVGSIAFVGQRGLTREGIFYTTVQSTSGGDELMTADPVQVQADFAAVQALLKRERPHLDPDLTAQQLADRLGWAPERLTRALRDGGGANFFNTINAARVAEVQKAMADPQKARTSVLALGFDAGFGSKTALYDAFGRATGCSPAEWRRRRGGS